MKNNKGFTLVELLVTVGLIGAIGVVVGFSVTNLIKNQNEQRYTEYKKTLEDAACVLAQRQNINQTLCSEFASLCKIEIKDLVAEGVIKKTLVNPQTQKSAEEESKLALAQQNYVSVTYVNGLRKCEFQEVNK